MLFKKLIAYCCLCFVISNTCFGQQPRLVLPIGHTDKITSVSLSPDGKTILTTSEDSTVKLWDVVTGFLLTDLEGHNAVISSASFSPDGKKIVTASQDSVAMVWEAASGKLLLKLKGHRSYLRYAAFSPDGKNILTTSGDSTINIWNSNTGTIITTFRDAAVSVHSIFSADGKILYNISFDRQIKKWDIQSGTLLLDIKSNASSILPKFSPDAKKMVTFTSYNTAKIWDALSGRLLVELKGHTAEIASANFAVDGNKLVTTSEDSTVKVWDLSTGVIMADFNGLTKFSKARFSPDGTKILTNSQSTTNIVLERYPNSSLEKVLIKYHNSIKIRDHSSAVLLAELKGRTNEIESDNFSPDGTKIVVLTDDNDAQILDFSSGKVLANLKGNGTAISTANFTPDGKKIVTLSLDRYNTVSVWDAYSGELVSNLRSHTEVVSGAQFSPDGKKFFTSLGHLTGLHKEYDNYTGKLWDVTTGTLLVNLKGQNDLITNYEFSPDSKKLLTNSFIEKNIKILNTGSGELLTELTGHKNIITSAYFSPDGRKIVSTSWDATAKIWDANSGKLLLDLKGHTDNVNTANFSPDEKKIVTAAGSLMGGIRESGDQTAKVWDANSGELIVDLTGHTASLHWAGFSPDGNKILTVSKDSTAKLWETASGNLLINFKNLQPSHNAARFSPDGKKIITVLFNNTIAICDAGTGFPLTLLKGHNAAVKNIFLSPDGKTIITTSADKTAKLWDAYSGLFIKSIECTSSEYFEDIDLNSKRVLTSNNSEVNLYSFQTENKLASFISIDSNDYIVQLPSKYYLSTRNSAKLLHYVTTDLKVISFEQLDIKYNRPDKVLEALGNTDTALINSYRKAYEKRIKKLGIDTTAFRDGYSVPTADFANRDAIEYEIKNEKLILHIKGNDSSYKLDRFNIWVNEAPIFGQRGISLRNKNSNSFDSSITIKLSQGTNSIETSVRNVNGTESYRIPLIINYTPAIKQKEKVHFIGIGIDKFVEKKYNLQYSVKDIRDLAKKMKEKYGNDIFIDTLFNENVCLSNIKALKKKLLKTTENDKIIIAYSGHGMLSKDYDYFLSTYAVNFENPEQDGLPYDELENLLDSIPARKKLLLIDACHSGEVDKEELEKLKTSMATAAFDIKGAKGVTPLFTQGSKKLGMKNSFELMQQLFVNVGRSTGATIISAAAGTQFALERGDLKNGVFTYAILEFMKDHPTATIAQLKTYVNKRVPELTKGLQVPTSRTETNMIDWKVW